MARAKAKTPSSSLTIRVALDASDDTPMYYVNYLEVTHSQYEFGLLAARMPVKLTPQKLEEAKRTGTIHIEPDLILVIPPTVIPGLIRALASQKTTYEEKFGVISAEEKGEEK